MPNATTSLARPTPAFLAPARIPRLRRLAARLARARAGRACAIFAWPMRFSR